MEKINFIYLRTSTEEQNPENQLKDCQDLCAKENIIDGFIIEDKTSGWTEYDREGFNKIINKIKARRVNNLVCWDLDRLFRNRKKLVSFFKLCATYECKIYSYRQDWLNDINKIPMPWNEIIHEFMVQIIGWLAEEESNKKSDRVKQAVRIKDNVTISYKGNKWGRKQLSTQKKNLIKNLHDGGLSIRKIAKTLEISVGGVHKYISEFNKKKSDNLTNS